jgi:metal-responsive CopG/Arc/MetJ family transcriptional regulator
MKKNYSTEKRKKITVTIDNDLIILLDSYTSNRSHAINLSLKEYLSKNGYDTTKIKI